MAGRRLHQLLEDAAARYASNVAVIDPGRASISYRDLNRLAERIAASLQAQGVGPGDRVGLHARKSIGTVATIFGILKCDAAYVPVDATAPASRNIDIFSDCNVRCIVVQRPSQVADPVPGSVSGFLDGVDALLEGYVVASGPRNATTVTTTPPDDLAYILYTSGSTGRPKGVMLTHDNALAFIDWCSQTFLPETADRFSSHAPFHFDLSIFDIYVPLRHGAAIVLVAEDAGRQPKQLSSLIANERITVWYSTPSILKLLLDVKDVGAYDFSALRAVLFAGEVFPIKQLRRLQSLWPAPRYYNLYGPTETNVCTYHEVPRPLPADRTEPVPLGRACSGDRVIVANEAREPVARGSEGELCVSGPSVTCGYWNRTDRNATAFFEDTGGTRWYMTGDIVREEADGVYVYIGRRDRMVKRRGYRVELGEIEAALYRHESITEAAVIAVQDENDEMSIVAFITWSGVDKPSLIKLKRFCIDQLPAYMVPDRFSVQHSLPKTSTDKIHYQRLRELA
ncbi:MAG TPA: amino acid adenylation domain-containing protein [Woeseiaceae bacterium]|nr:amino acid adenylation domain-containing protein [Woeseiaceae bacterium]